MLNRKQRSRTQEELEMQLTSPKIDCRACEHVQITCPELAGVRDYRCTHPRALTLRGKVIHRDMGDNSATTINAPKECMRRPPCPNPMCVQRVTRPCTTCGRSWGA